MPTIPITILVIVLVIVLFVAALILFRAMMYGRVPDAVTPAEERPVDGQVVAEHLSEVLRIASVSEQDRSKIDQAGFEELHRTLERLYPRTHAVLKRELVNEYALLFTWMGRNLDLEPALLMGHIDVVPADPATLEEWTHPPFSGVIADGFVWGRGALDTKNTVVGVLEAVELLLKEDYQPERTLYLAFGHDEEIGGMQGAAAISAMLEARGVRLMAVLDEGGMIVKGILPGIEVPVAVVGIAEKGHTTLELVVEGRPGHSSTPPPHTGIGVLARAITRLENNPMPTRLAMARLMFEEVGAFLPMTFRMALANGWLFDGMLSKRMAKSPTTNAMIRTSTAATVINGGVKDNILPARAEARVNFRIMPGDRVADVMAHARKVIHDDAVQISAQEYGTWEASPVSPIDSPVFHDLADTIREIFPESVVAPYLVLGATDARYFSKVSGAVYRFTPCTIDSAMLQTIHGNNERIAVDVLPRLVQFYVRLIDEWTGS